jgi:SAM-dependent methyltransferase
MNSYKSSSKFIKSDLTDQIRIIIYSIYSAIKNRGLIPTAQMICISVCDQINDYIHGIDAHQFMDSAKLLGAHPSAPFANFYQPVRAIPFHKLMRTLNLPVSSNFTDIGAGTGKSLILANKYPFKKLIGIEIVPELCERATVNLKKKLSAEKFQIICDDALNYKFNSDDQFFFLNDPFSEEVFRPWIKLLLNHQKQIQSPVTLIYKNNNMRKIPTLEKLKSELEQKNNYQEMNTWGNFFQIFEIK